VSAKGRNINIVKNQFPIESFIQTDAAINMGNSGGALVDARGRLIGINSAILSPSRGNIGIGFAIPINLASFIMNSLVETGGVARGYLGVTSDTVTADVAEQLGMSPGTRGVVITDIDPGCHKNCGPNPCAIPDCDWPALEGEIRITKIMIARAKKCPLRHASM
jgi:serine protease Do/serine protease DegQ